MNQPLSAFFDDEGFLRVNPAIYTSRTALLDWLDGEGSGVVGHIKLGARIWVKTIGTNHLRMTNVTRMKRGGSMGRGCWRITRPHEIGDGAKQERRRRDTHTERLNREKDREERTAKGAFGSLLDGGDESAKGALGGFLDTPED